MVPTKSLPPRIERHASWPGTHAIKTRNQNRIGELIELEARRDSCGTITILRSSSPDPRTARDGDKEYDRKSEYSDTQPGQQQLYLLW